MQQHSRPREVVRTYNQYFLAFEAVYIIHIYISYNSGATEIGGVSSDPLTQFDWRLSQAAATSISMTRSGKQTPV